MTRGRWKSFVYKSHRYFFFFPVSTHLCCSWRVAGGAGADRQRALLFESLQGLREHIRLTHAWVKTPRHTHTHTHTSRLTQTYTFRARHKIYNNKSLPKRHWNAQTISQAALNSGWSAICYLEHLAKQKRLQPKHLKGLIAHVAHKFRAVWLKHTVAFKLARQQNENTLIQLETQAYLLKYKCLNW